MRFIKIKGFIVYAINPFLFPYMPGDALKISNMAE